ncbi:MAG TPA: NAD(P)-binding domain-containing protein, partial [Acidimicrobiales bacterium]|nr:NAD(P)-binding domain-containing protein [Acidimicrobiales bacterium]
MSNGVVAVVGAGSWGTTVAALLAARGPTALWARSPELADAIASDHENARYLPGIELPRLLRPTASMADAVDGASIVLVAVPSHGFRGVLEAMAPV